MEKFTTRKNARTFTRIVEKKSYSKRNKNITKKKKSKRIMPLEIYFPEIYFWRWCTHMLKKINKYIKKILAAESLYTFPMVSRLKNMTNLQKMKIVFKTDNKKTMVR